MSEQQIILDYASPRKRSKFRLASGSLLESRWEGENLIIREWLAGQAGAVVAIVATFFMVGNLALEGFVEWEHLNNLVVAVIAAFFVAGWLTLVPAIIQQTWRETVLRIGDGAMKLSMGGPFSRQHYQRRFDQVQAVRVISTQVRDGAPLLAEIEILADNAPPIRLFTDHPEARLVLLSQEIDQAVRGVAPGEVTPAPNASVDAWRKLRGEDLPH
jgi:hypothetical protein